jgi:hypothetical protein
MRCGLDGRSARVYFLAFTYEFDFFTPAAEYFRNTWPGIPNSRTSKRMLLLARLPREWLTAGPDLGGRSDHGVSVELVDDVAGRGAPAAASKLRSIPPG